MRDPPRSARERQASMQQAASHRPALALRGQGRGPRQSRPDARVSDTSSVTVTTNHPARCPSSRSTAGAASGCASSASAGQLGSDAGAQRLLPKGTGLATEARRQKPGLRGRCLLTSTTTIQVRHRGEELLEFVRLHDHANELHGLHGARKLPAQFVRPVRSEMSSPGSTSRLRTQSSRAARRQPRRGTVRMLVASLWFVARPARTVRSAMDAERLDRRLGRIQWSPRYDIRGRVRHERSRLAVIQPDRSGRPRRAGSSPRKRLEGAREIER